MNPPDKLFHPRQGITDFGHDVLAVNLDTVIRQVAQSCVQSRAILGDVDVLAPKHGFHPLRKIAAPGQLDQKLKRLIGDQIF